MLSIVATRRSADSRSGASASERPPGAFEFIDLGNQRQDFRGDPESVDIDGHTRINTQLQPNSKPNVHPITPD